MVFIPHTRATPRTRLVPGYDLLELCLQGPEAPHGTRRGTPGRFGIGSLSPVPSGAKRCGFTCAKRCRPSRGQGMLTPKEPFTLESRTGSPKVHNLDQNEPKTPPTRVLLGF